MASDQLVGELGGLLSVLTDQVRDFVERPRVKEADLAGAERIIEMLDRFQKSLQALGWLDKRSDADDIAGSHVGRHSQQIGAAWNAVLLRKLNRGLAQALSKAELCMEIAKTDNSAMKREPAAAPSSEKAPGPNEAVFPGKHFNLPEIIQFLSYSGKDGRIEISEPGGDCLWLELRGGNLVWAASKRPRPGLRLGDLLVQQGALGKASLHEVLSRKDVKERPLGQTLMDEGLITAEQLGQALEAQLQGLFGASTKLKAQHIRFSTECDRDIDAEFSIDLNWLLLEEARLADEVTR